MYFELNRIFLFNLKNIVCEGVVWDCVFRLKTKFVFVYLGGGGGLCGMVGMMMNVGVFGVYLDHCVSNWSSDCVCSCYILCIN